MLSANPQGQENPPPIAAVHREARCCKAPGLSQPLRRSTGDLDRHPQQGNTWSWVLGGKEPVVDLLRASLSESVGFRSTPGMEEPQRQTARLSRRPTIAMPLHRPWGEAKGKFYNAQVKEGGFADLPSLHVLSLQKSSPEINLVP